MKIPRQLVLVPLFEKALQMIATANHIVLASPRDPDVDSCMSMLAFRNFLETEKKNSGIPFFRFRVMTFGNGQLTKQMHFRS